MTFWTGYLWGALTWSIAFAIFVTLDDCRACRKAEARKHINGEKENL